MVLQGGITFAILLIQLLVAQIPNERQLLACGDNETASDGNRLFRSNVWRRLGAGEQCLFHNGWVWTWEDVGYDVQAFPSAAIGRSPWASHSTDPRFPVKIGDLQQLDVMADVVTEATGEFNTVLDIWLIDKAPADAQGIQAELMVWLFRGALNPAGTSRGTRVVKGASYELFVGETDGEIYAAFVPKEAVRTGLVDVLAFVQQLLDEGLVSPAWYISVVEVGNEVVSGSGATIVNGYAVDVELR